MLEWLAIALGGVATYLTRAIFVISKRVVPPKRTLRFLPLVGPAVIGAITVPGILAPRGAITLVDTIPALVAAVAAVLLQRWTKQLPIALIGSLVLWWAIVAVLSGLGIRQG